MPDLNGFYLISEIGLRPLIDAGLELVGVYDEVRSVPESDGIAVVERITVALGNVVAAVGIDSADVVDHFIHQPCLVRCNDELAQERLSEPPRMTRWSAGREVIPFDAIFEIFKPLRQLRLEFR